MFDTAAAVRAIRRHGTLSQRELAAKANVDPKTVAEIEVGRRNAGIAIVARLAEAAGLRVAIVDANGREVRADGAHDAIRDRGGRRFPAHLEWDGRPLFEPMGRMWWGWTHLPGYLLDQGSIIPDFVYWQREKPPREGEWREHPYFGRYQARAPRDAPTDDPRGESGGQSRPSDGPPA